VKFGVKNRLTQKGKERKKFYSKLFSLVFFFFIFNLMNTRLAYLIPLLLISLLALFNTAHSQYPDSLVQALVNQTNLDTLSYYVNVLSGEDSVTISGQRYLITSRYWAHTHNDLAADFIYQTLQKTGLPVLNQNYSSGGRNVIATQIGTTFPDQQFIICAHYDDVPSSPPAPGADDNASGTAAVLEAARILSQVSTPYTVIYALWDEEEIGLIGSGYYAAQATANGDNILGVVNLEMFGWDGNDDGQFEIHTRPTASSVQLANTISSLVGIYQIGLFTLIHNPGTTASDHSSFWIQGYSAIVFSQAFFGGDSNPFYHTSNDRITHFNLGYFYALSRLALASIAHLANFNMVLDIDDGKTPIISDLELEQNYPNPFNPVTNINFYLPYTAEASLKIYNVLGEEVTTLLSALLPSGLHTVQWNATEYPSGVYLYRLSTDQGSLSRKMILME
jgi:hypothetical protein